MEIKTKPIFQPYPKYKDTGIKWFGEVPEHWEIVPGFTVLKEKKVKNKGLIEKQVLSLSYGNIIVKTEDKLTGLVPASFETYQIVNAYDIIIRPTDLQNDKVSLRVGFSNKRGIITSAYLNLEVINDNDPKYIYYFLHDLDITKVLYGLGSGLRQNLDFEDFKRFEFLTPPKPEQTRIANFLDRKCEKIDKAISQKERLIELLKERRQIIIQNAVTRGLDPNVPLKDSGVEWIGKIPEHWEVKRLKYVSSINSGDPIINSNIKDTGLYEVFGGNGFMGYANDYNIKGEKIIIGRVGALCGNIRYSNKKRWISDNALILKLHKGESYSFFFFLLKAGNLNTLNSSNAQPLITGTKVMNFAIPYPPLKEQKEIVSYIEKNYKNIENAIDFQNQQIKKLKEYKSVLIDNAVTGKIKVS